MKIWYVLCACVVLAWCTTACCGMLYADRSKEYYELKAQVDAAKAVIDQVWEDQENYCLDVLVEGDAYQTWLELTE